MRLHSRLHAPTLTPTHAYTHQHSRLHAPTLTPTLADTCAYTHTYTRQHSRLHTPTYTYTPTLTPTLTPTQYNTHTYTRQHSPLHESPLADTCAYTIALTNLLHFHGHRIADGFLVPGPRFRRALVAGWGRGRGLKYPTGARGQRRIGFVDDRWFTEGQTVLTVDALVPTRLLLSSARSGGG